MLTPMPPSSETQWILVGCGLIAHADEALEVGEWEQFVAFVEADVRGDDVGDWLDAVADPGKIEDLFASLPALAPERHEHVLYRCWQMALADGHGSDVEQVVHDRIAQRLGFDASAVAALRQTWTATAARRAELALGLAAVLANLDGRLDPAEAAKFSELLERAPVPVHRRLDLGEQLTAPPDLDAVVSALTELPVEERRAALRDVAPMVHASARGDAEREAFLSIAGRVGIGQGEAAAMIG
jgi:uncharacterized tellurite resistance protein B-like protein